MNKKMTAADVVAQLRDGMTIGIGGWATRRKPMALVREIMRSPLRDLTVVSYGGPDVGLLAAAGKLRKLIFGFVSLDVLPLDMHFRNARQAGAFEVMELDEGMVQLGLRAAVMRVPFLPTPVGLGTDVVVRNPGIRLVRSPYDDASTLVAMPALRLDAALLHVTEADERGNSVILSPDPFFDDLMGRAADRVYLSCEQIVATTKICNHDRARYQPFERSVVTGVVEAPFGAHPTAGVPGYGIDIDHLKEYNAATTSEAWAAYRARYVDLPTHDDYVAAVGGRLRINSIPPPVY
ncbi:MAG: CoA transferase subunit A [Gammaproteobacteria bacterium]|nr:CoA transferase subunit A [Gammaproteobacteria bacterium]